MILLLIPGTLFVYYAGSIKTKRKQKVHYKGYKLKIQQNCYFYKR